MSKLISKKYAAQHAGQKIIMPGVGEVEFDAQGVLEVEDSKVEALIADTKESFDFEVEGKKKVEDDEDVENAEWKQKLDEATSEELLELAKEAKLGEPAVVAAWTDKKLKKELLKALTGK